MDTENEMEVSGRDLVAGLPKTVKVSSAEIRESLAETVSQMVERVKGVLELTPPELSSDVIERGITLTGGGALLRGFDQLLALATGISVHVAEDPLSCVAIGTGRALEEWQTLRETDSLTPVYG
jgi:rod shape-determining protein MreB